MFRHGNPNRPKTVKHVSVRELNNIHNKCSGRHACVHFFMVKKKPQECERRRVHCSLWLSFPWEQFLMSLLQMLLHKCLYWRGKAGYRMRGRPFSLAVHDEPSRCCRTIIFDFGGEKCFFKFLQLYSIPVICKRIWAYFLQFFHSRTEGDVCLLHAIHSRLSPSLWFILLDEIVCLILSGCVLLLPEWMNVCTCAIRLRTWLLWW